MFSRETKDEIIRVAHAAGVEPAALLAIAEVESGGRAFAVVPNSFAPPSSGKPLAGARKEPLIRFEGHYFDRLVDDGKRAEARRAGLASPKTGGVANPASQAARWRLLADAMAIDRAAALQSVSWGIGQVMGSHWKALGYGSVAELVAEARSGVGGQIRLMLRFLEVNGLIGVIAAHDWKAFARAYNGPRYHVHRYDSRIAAAYARHSRDGAGKAAQADGLKRGDAGEAVVELQRMLTAAGYPLAQDGRFGPATARGVARFQADRRLAETGVAGPETMAALSRALGGAPISRLASWMIGVIRRMLPLAARLARRRAGRGG